AVHRRDAEGGIQTFEERVTSVGEFENVTSTVEAAAPPGCIAKVAGLGDIRIGDVIGSPEEPPSRGLFTPPTLETVVRPVDPSGRIRLHRALVSLAERDPLVDPHLDELTGHMAV